MRSIAVAATLVSLACTSPATPDDAASDATALDAPTPDAGRPADAFPPSAPLVCDPAGAGVVDFVFHVSEGVRGGTYWPHGSMLLAIDRSCRYVVYTLRSARGGVLRAGVLDPTDLAALNDELLAFRWAWVDGGQHNFGTGGDAWTLTFRRGDLQAQCYMTCRGSVALQALEAAARSWVDRLWERGAAVDGPVLVHVVNRVGEPAAEPVPWSGTPLAGMREVLVEDETDVATLRSLRAASTACCGAPIFLLESDALIGVGVADILPFDVELRTDRAFGPLPP